nr:nad-dependent protein deacylase [Quercus suber]
MASHLDAQSATCESPELVSFHQCLTQSNSIIALVGAGLSASSGVNTFSSNRGTRAADEAASLATLDALQTQPHRVWALHAHRQYEAVAALPNADHIALANASKRCPGLITLNQNVDDLCERAGHPQEQLLSLHGSLFEIHCPDRQGCGYSEKHFTDPSLLEHTSHILAPWSETELEHGLPSYALPSCPQCRLSMRPGIVLYGERLTPTILARVREAFSVPDGIDIMLVVGTAAEVYPAAGYVDVARARGARLCVVNEDGNVSLRAKLLKGD